MRRFNPEKELRKMQNGNRNKIILGVLALLIIIGISSSYALYQVRYSKRIIYTKVKMNRKDIELAVKIDGQDGTLDHFPSNEEGLVYSGIECDNQDITKATWNYETWSLDLNSSGPNKCVITFKEGTTPSLSDLCSEEMPLSECIAQHGLEVADIAKDTSVHHNLRYIGNNPNNYIWYNCDDYTDLTQESAEQQCEKWQIIGLFSVIETLSETYNIVNDVKIIRADSIGEITWDKTNRNNWETASLQKGLNELYLNGSDSTWITSTEYTYSGNTNIIADNYKSITAATKNMIEKVTWNLGGLEGPLNTATASDYYSSERGEETYNSQPKTWDGYIGLMYPSDFGYATSGLKYDQTPDRSGCLNIPLHEWYIGVTKTNCAGNDWLNDSSTYQWTITPNSNRSFIVWRTDAKGLIDDWNANAMHAVRPTLYLKSSVKLIAGDGSGGTPYIVTP